MSWQPLSLSRTAADSLLLRVVGRRRVGAFLQHHAAARLRVEGTVWFLLSLPLALFVPQISYVINPIGGLAAAFIFIFPGGLTVSCCSGSFDWRV